MPAKNAAEALQILLEGNRRFREDPDDPGCRLEGQTLSELTAQAPLAAVMACSDSRVPVETVFGQGPGRVFVIRSAGHTIDLGALGSIEFAVTVLRVPLVLVLGHTGCAAVAAARDPAATLPPHMHRIVEQVRAALPAELAGDGVAEHASATVRELLAACEELRRAVDLGRVGVHAAVFELETGRVRILDA